MKKRSQKKTHVAKHNNKRWKIKTFDGRTTVKGKDYQEDDVNGGSPFSYLIAYNYEYPNRHFKE